MSEKERMMRTCEDIESYLVQLGLPYETVKEGLWVIHDEENRVGKIVVACDPPIVVFRVKVMEVPPTNREALFRRLLELNATDLVHGAYGIEGESIVLIDTLQLENLDFNEFQASIEALELAVSGHFESLNPYRG